MHGPALVSRALDNRWHIPDGVRRLPFIVGPREHEPAESILVRLALANGYRTIQRLLRATPHFPGRLCHSDLTRGKCIALATRLGGLAEGSLDGPTPHRAAGGITLHGHYFRRLRTIGNARVCPACLADDTKHLDGRKPTRPHRRNFWEIHNIGACPFHMVPLVDSCPKCNTRLELTKSSVSCACDPRVDLRRMAGEAVPDEDMVHDRWLLGRLGIGEQREHGFLDAMAPDLGSRLCLIVGTLVENEFKALTGAFRASYSVRARSLGWRVLQEWPLSFDAFLDGLIAHNSAANKLRAMRTARYSGLFNPLCREEAPGLEIVFDAIRSHASRNLLISPKTHIRGHIFKLGEEVAIVHASQLAGCSRGRFVEICEALDLPMINRGYSGAAVVPTAYVGAVKGFWKNSVEAVEICKILGCNHKVVDNLAQLGVLRIKLKGKSRVSTVFQRSDFEKILNAISTPLEENIEFSDDLITEKQAVKAIWRGEAAILKGLVSGELRAIGRQPGTDGFEGMIFRRSDLLSAIPKLTGSVPSLSVLNEAGWQASTIAYLKRMGYLKNNQRAIDLADLKEFQEQYVAMREMLQWDGDRSARRIRQILEAARIEPEIAPRKHITGFWPRLPAQRALWP